MTITATELKTNLGKYLEMAASEDIIITKNGTVIAILTKPQFERIAILNSLIGFAKGDSDFSLEEIKDERLAKQ